MDHHRQSFLRQLQSLDEPMKTKVLVLSTVVVMVVVVYFWLGYFNSIVSAPVNDGQPVANGQQDNQPTFFQKMADAARSVGQLFEKPREYQVKPN